MPPTLEQRIQALERRTQPVIPYGPVLTSARSLNDIMLQQRRGNFELIKVVTSWGIPNGWTPDAIDQVMRTFKHVIVRTSAGDPSSQSSNPLPVYDDVIRELIAWINAMHDGVTVWFEIGNEPNIRHDQAYYWLYRYHLLDTILKLRKRYPTMVFIAPGISVDPLHLQFGKDYTTILHDVCGVQAGHFQYQAIHAYEVNSWVTLQTQQLQIAMGLYSKETPFVLSEFGLNSLTMSMQAKEDELRSLCNTRISERIFAASYYHLAMLAHDAEQKRYHIYI